MGERSRIIGGDALEELGRLPERSVDVVVTDPPYGIGIMGRSWDAFEPENVRRLRKRKRGKLQAAFGANVQYDESPGAAKRYQEWAEKWGREMLPALKPGANVLVCAAPRTQHRLVCGLEDAGYTVRDLLIWLHGSGFPKSADLGDGLGSALKPSWEPIFLLRAPLDGTLASTHAEHRTGALDVRSCLIPGAAGDGHWSGEDGSDSTSRPGYEGGFTNGGRRSEPRNGDGGGNGDVVWRWPANVAVDEAAAAMIDAEGGIRPRKDGGKRTGPKIAGNAAAGDRRDAADGVKPSRFFFCAKVGTRERNRGCEDMRRPGERHGNNHPTVKPLALMRWVLKLSSRREQTVLDPFCGSGTTGIACAMEDRRFIGIEREERYREIARRRIEAWTAGGPLFG